MEGNDPKVVTQAVVSHCSREAMSASRNGNRERTGNPTRQTTDGCANSEDLYNIAKTLNGCSPIFDTAGSFPIPS